MVTVQAKLAQWRSLYDALCAAEQQLRRAQGGGFSGGPGVTELRLEVRRLQDEAEQALNAVDAALAAARHGCGSPA